MGYIFLILAMSLNAFANIMLKLGSGNLSAFKSLAFFDAIVKNQLFFLGLFCFALNVVFYSLALSKIPLSIGYPVMMGGGLAIIAVVSTTVLKENLTALQGLGLLLLFAGAFLIINK